MVRQPEFYVLIARGRAQRPIRYLHDTEFIAASRWLIDLAALRQGETKVSIGHHSGRGILERKCDDWEVSNSTANRRGNGMIRSNRDRCHAGQGDSRCNSL